MVGLGEIDELEVKAEGAGELVGGGQVERMDAGERLLQMSGCDGLVGGSGLWASASRRAMAMRRSSSTAS